MELKGFFGFLLILLIFIQSTSVLAVLSDSSLKVFAVTTEGTALSADLQLEIIPGTGRILTAVTPLVGTATQSTERIAVKVAGSYFKNVKNYDYIFTIHSTAAVVDGPSAGGAMALLVVSALQDNLLPPEVGLTGTITEDGAIGPVGGVYEKAKKASEVGIKLFMIPRGEASQIVRQAGVVENVNLPDYALKNWGMKVIEVSTLDDVLKFAFSKIEDINVEQTAEESDDIFIPEKIDVSEKALPLSTLTHRIVENTKGLVEDAKKSISNTLLEDNTLIAVLLDSLNDSEKTLSESELLLQNNYLYSAGNFAFLSKVNAYLVKDLADNPSILQPTSAYTDTKLNELKAKIEKSKIEFQEFIPIEGLEWYVAAQQRLSWAELNVNNLLADKTLMVVDDGSGPEYTGLIEKLRDYEFARAWYDASQDLYGIAIEESQHKIKPDSAFKEYYSELITNTENGLTVIPDDKDEPQRRLNAAKLNQSQGADLSAAMNAASALALVNASLSSQDKDAIALEKLLNEKIESIEFKMSSFSHEFAWPNLYLDHAKYFLKSAQHARETNQGSSVRGFLENGMTLAFLAENTLLVTEDIVNYYDKIDAGKLSTIDHTTSSNNLPSVPTVSIRNPFTNLDKSTLEGILILIIIAVVGIVIGGYLSKKFASQSFVKGSKPSSSATELLMLDKLEANLFASKHALKRLEQQYDSGMISKPEFDKVSDDYRKEISTIRQQIRSVPSSAAKLPPLKKFKPKNPVLALKKSESEKGVLSED